MFNQNDIFANRYILTKKIGIGGFSEVWQATDQMAEDAVIALKIYAPERGMDEHGLKQFRREYAVVLNLNHPNLLTARHFDVWEGRPYLVMPFIQGGSLHGMLMEKGNLSEWEIAGLLSQIANGLDYLHGKEILHQDIKPDNILIDSDGSFLLTDFGISSRLRSTLRKSTTSAKALTVAYAPPERFAASPQTLPASDIFSLGVLLYELTTGDVPWMGSGGISLTIGAEVPEITGNYSQGFKRMVTTMMALNPDARPTAAQIATGARQFLQNGTWPAFGYIPPQDVSSVPPDVVSGGRPTQRIEDVHPPVGTGGHSTSPSNTGQHHREEHQLGGNPTVRSGSGGSTLGGDSGIRTSPGPAKKKSGGAAVWIVAAIVVLAAVGGGAWFYMQQQEKAKTEAFERRQAFENEVNRGDELYMAGNLQDALTAYLRAEVIISDDDSLENKISQTRNLIEEENKKREEAEQQARLTQAQEIARLQQEADRLAREDEQRRIREQQQAEERRRFDALPAPVRALVTDMVQVPGGTIALGCISDSDTSCFDDEKPSRNITISTFSIGKFEVTDEQWALVMGTTPDTECPKCPAQAHSWNQIQDFIRRLNQMTGRTFRLPTEAEWEFAARGGTRTRGFRFSGGNSASTVGWFLDNSVKSIRTVGGLTANELGIFDMSGNVWEWVSDWYSENYYQSRPSTNPRGPSTGTGKVIRGGGAMGDISAMRVSARFEASPETTGLNTGFRLVLQQ